MGAENGWEDYMTKRSEGRFDVDASIIEIAELFTKTAFRRFPVLKENRLGRPNQAARGRDEKVFVKLHQQGGMVVILSDE